MSFRMHRSFKIASGLRMNLGLRGSSLTFGGRGASINVGPRGVYSNVSMPGSGISYRGRIDSSRAKGYSGSSQLRETYVRLVLGDDGAVTVADPNGVALPPRFLNKAISENPQAFSIWLSENVKKFNAESERLGSFYRRTPAPLYRSCFRAPTFPIDPPSPPVLPSLPAKPIGPGGFRPSLLARLLPPLQRRLEAAHKRSVEKYQREVEAWQAKTLVVESTRTALAHEHGRRVLAYYHERLVRVIELLRRQREHEELIRSDPDFMLALLEEALRGCDWPRETSVAAGISDDGLQVELEVDLPEIEDFPRKHAEVAASGRRLQIKDKAESALRLDYARHIHGILFYLAGLTFSVLPVPQVAIISGYSQRRDRHTGVVQDEYLLSVEIRRPKFSRFDFSHLDALDPIDALSSFPLRREMSKTVVLKPIEPIVRIVES